MSFRYLFFFSFIISSPLIAQDDYKQYLDLSYPEIDSLMYIEYGKGAFNKAIPLMMAGREKAKIEFGTQDSVFTEYTNNVGAFYQLAGQYTLALPFSIEVVEIQEKILGGEHPHFAISLNNLASLYLKIGDYNKALPLSIRAKNIRRKILGSEHPDFATSLNNLATLHNAMGNYDEALSLHVQAKNIREKTLGKNHPDFASSLNNLADLQERMGNYDQALPLFIQAKNIKESVQGNQHPDFASCLNNLASLYNKMGDYDQALPLLIQAKDIKENILGKEHADVAVALNNLAAVHKVMGDYDEALLFYNEALKIVEKALGKEHYLFAVSLSNLGTLYETKGDYDQALPLYIEALNIIEKSQGKEHPEFVTYLNNLAGLYKKMEDYEKTKIRIIQAIQTASLTDVSWEINPSWADRLYQATYPSNAHLNSIVTSLELMYELLQRDKSIKKPKEKQEIVANLAIKLLNKLQQELSNEKDKLRILELSSRWLYRNLNSLNVEKNSSKAFTLSDQNKSVLLLEATKSEQAYKIGDLPNSLVSKEKKMLKTQSQLQAKLVERRSKLEKDSLRNELIQINQDIEAFRQMLQKDYPKYYKLKYKQVRTKTEEIQALLKKNTALIEYVISDTLIHIFYLDKKQVQWKKTRINKETLKNRIKKFHQALSNYKTILKDETKAYRTYTIDAHWFYETLLVPVLQDKEAIQNLILITDGELGHLPFETFLVEQAPQNLTAYDKLHYLIKDYTISYNYSATLWKENLEAPIPQNNNQILGMAANYNLKIDSVMRDIRLSTDQRTRGVLGSLPAARQEVEMLQERYQGLFVFDVLASEKTVKEKAPDFAILHFATHGILDHKRPILSSLVFSEDNDRLESNFWQAHEISKAQINANLVVLSACETGYGKFESGNGIASLARSFMYAGASSLIVSLWQVNDYATSALMENLYGNLADGMEIDEALRSAKLGYMENVEGVLGHPVFWSPFIQIGNTQPVQIKRKGETMPWVILGFVVAILLVGGFALRRRRKEVA